MFRPADAIETAECWELALKRSDGPSLLALSRQSLPALRVEDGENRSARGGYVLAEAEGARAATVIATGSEVSLAIAAREVLAAEGVAVAVVSLPCWELFAQQDASYRATVLGGAPASASRRRAASAGSAGSASAARSSAWPGSAPRRPTITCTNISASLPRQSLRP